MNTIFVERNLKSFMDILLNSNQTDASFTNKDIFYQVMTIMGAVSFFNIK